jgi:3-hexulose-6-phosphate synthase/6-phospho-3-hexuloisomerase
VQCGGQVIRPGDWVTGDDDGVVVIPTERLAAVVATAKQIIEAEKILEQAIRKGADLGQLLKASEIIQRKQSEVFIPQLRVAGRKPRSS